MPDDQGKDAPEGQISEAPGTGGADAVPDTPDAVPQDENRPTRLNQPTYPSDDSDEVESANDTGRNQP